MFLREIWRHPVKSTAGERLTEVTLGEHGILGDRLVQARDAQGRLLTARTRPRLLGLHGTLGPEGSPLVDGLPWGHPEVRAAVERAAGSGAHLVAAGPAHRFDVLPLLVATAGAIAALGVAGFVRTSSWATWRGSTSAGGRGASCRSASASLRPGSSAVDAS